MGLTPERMWQILSRCQDNDRLVINNGEQYTISERCHLFVLKISFKQIHSLFCLPSPFLLFCFLFLYLLIIDFLWYLLPFIWLFICHSALFQFFNLILLLLDPFLFLSLSVHRFPCLPSLVYFHFAFLLISFACDRRTLKKFYEDQNQFIIIVVVALCFSASSSSFCPLKRRQTDHGLQQYQ